MESFFVSYPWGHVCFSLDNAKATADSVAEQLRLTNKFYILLNLYYIHKAQK